MKSILKVAGAIGVAGVMALAAVTPSQARGGRVAAAVAGGLVAGAVIGAAAANSGYYYGGPGYYYGPGYAYEPAYAYGPGYAYGPAPVYAEPVYAAPVYAQPVYRGGRCWVSTDSDRGFGYYRAC